MDNFTAKPRCLYFYLVFFFFFKNEEYKCNGKQKVRLYKHVKILIYFSFQAKKFIFLTEFSLTGDHFEGLPSIFLESNFALQKLYLPNRTIPLTAVPIVGLN